MKRGNVVRVYRPKSFHDGKWFGDYFEATVLAVSDGYAMVRSKVCAPFVESVKDLERWAKETKETT